MKKTYTGSCYCGAVRYEAALDLSAGTLRCNCPICTRARGWLVTVAPGNFRLLAGESALTECRFELGTIHHLFCKHCGVRSFARGDGSPAGGPLYAINVNCLEDVDAAEIAAAPALFVHGSNENWQSPAAEPRGL
ncbi:MAG: GFA family protein [Gammaproteobacteria bacterium]